MNDDIGETIFGEKPHRDEALAKSRWGLNSYNLQIVRAQRAEQSVGIIGAK